MIHCNMSIAYQMFVDEGVSEAMKSTLDGEEELNRKEQQVFSAR